MTTSDSHSTSTQASANSGRQRADRAAIIYNPVKIDRETLRATVAEREAKHAWGPSLWFETTESDPGEGMAREAIAQGAKLVIACGGDGTVRSVAAGLADSQVALGIIPLGTGNLLARNLGIPIDNLDRALAVAMGGTTSMIDLGRVHYVRPDGTEEDEVFLVMVGVGMDADMIAGTDEDLKATVGWVAYLQSFASSVLTGHRIKARYSIDDDEARNVHARAVIVGNCGALQGGVVLMPGAQLADGLLDLVALRPKGPVGWARLSYAVLVQNTVLAKLGVPPARKWAEQVALDVQKAAGQWAELLGPEGAARRYTEKSSLRRQRAAERRTAATSLDHRQGKRVDLEVLEKPAAFQIDGDDQGEVTRVRFEVRHRVLALRV